MDSGEEQGDAQAEVGQSVTLCAGDALDDLMQSQASQVVGHLPGGESAGRLAEEGGGAVAQMAVREPSRELWKRQQGVVQGLDLGIGEAERRSPLRGHLPEAMHLLKGLFGQKAITADFLDGE